jgi:pimeloyl-ACP methyl ester carboxylesterase
MSILPGISTTVSPSRRPSDFAHAHQRQSPYLHAMRTIYLSLGLLAALLCSACGAQPAPQDPTPATAPQVQPKANLAPGSLALHIAVAGDSTQRYGVYLPATYQPGTGSPVLYLFDAHARTALPLERYRALADQFGWVLIASATSRNGQQAQQSLAIYDALRRDTREKFWLDSLQVYVGGFSGGARVAAHIAQTRPGIAGVIGCGAGYQPLPGDRFAYIGLVGTEDFNYQEFRQLEQQPQQGDRLIEYFIGGHDWPPVPIMAKAFQYLQFRAMARKIRPFDAAQVDGMAARYAQQDSGFAALGQDRFRHELQQKTIAYLRDLVDTQAMQALYDQLESSTQVQALRQRQSADYEREMAMRQDYGARLLSASLTDWERMAGMLRKVARGEDEEAWLHQRVLSYLSLSSYMNASRALQASDLPAA